VDQRTWDSSIVKGLVWLTDGSRMAEGNVARVYGQSLGRRLIISLGKHATFFQAEVYEISASVYEIPTQDGPEKYVSISSDSLAALKAFQAAKTTSPLVQQYQRHWMISLPSSLWGCIGSLNMLGYKEMKSPTYWQGVVLSRSS
jgi:hypothetical protein